MREHEGKKETSMEPSRTDSGAAPQRDSAPRNREREQGRAIAGIAMVKNEQDIIEPFVRHHIAVVDRLFVVDNGSVDDTRRLLASLREEFPNLTVLDDVTFGYTQSEKMTALLRRCQSAFPADYVLPLDADEFLDAPGREFLLGELEKIPRGGFGLLPWSTFVLTPSLASAPAADPMETMTWRRRAEAPQYYKAVLRLDRGPADAIVIEQGNHSARSVGGNPLPSVLLPGLRLCHFPVRSRDQLIAKCVVGWMAYLAFDPHAAQRGQGLQWQVNFERIARDGGIDANSLAEASMLYAQPPRPVDWDADVVQDSVRFCSPRRYSTGQPLGAMELIARSWAQAMAALHTESRANGNARVAATPVSSPAPSACTSAAAEDSPGEAAERLLRIGKPKEAVALLDAALARGETAELWNDWATVQCGSGNARAAEEGYRRALRLEANHRQAAVNLGLFLLSQGRLAEGAAFLRPHESTLTGEEREALRRFAGRCRRGAAAPETAAGPRPLVRSFDVFDTLIARRCIEPLRIHELVEKKTGVAGFARQRRAAELAIASRDYSLDEIYAELGRMTGLDEAVCERLRQAEIETEIENALPIAGNLAQVRDGDLLVSDMYFDEATIRRLLSKAGFKKNVGVVVTAHGKSSGAIWPKLLGGFNISTHMGDSQQSDVDCPRRYGIAAQRTAVSAPNPVETWLIQNGLRDLALLCREVRLRTHGPDHLTRQLMDMQCSLNFPMLLLACAPLARLIRERGIRRVLFSSRDSEPWMKLFRKLAPQLAPDCEIEYFYTSRLARRSLSGDYLAYAADRLAGRTLLLDLCGTGWSIAHLLKRLGLERQPVFMLMRIEPLAAYEKLAPTPGAGEFHSIVGPQEKSVAITSLEMLNAVPYGSILDVRRIEGSICPVLDADNRPPATIEFFRRQNEVFDALAGELDSRDGAAWLALGDKTANAMVTALAREASRQPLLPALFMGAQVEEDKDVCNRLGCPDAYMDSALKK